MKAKIIIPTILAATILIAGMFAFMPVEQASTVHSTLSASFSQNNADNSADITIIAEGDGSPKHGWVCVAVNDAGDDVVTALVRTDIDPDTTNTIFQTVITNVDAESADGECIEFAGVSLTLVAGNAGDTADIIAGWTEGP